MNNNLISTFAVLKQVKKPLKLISLKIPNIKDDQVLVKIKFTYICGSQINEIDGKKGKDKYLPHLLGHESSGIIVRIGRKIKKLKENDRVILSWIKKRKKDPKNPSYKDLKGNTINSGPISTFSKYTIVGENRVYKVPKKIPLDIAALFGCAIPTGFGIIFNHIKKLNRNTLIGIYGCGGVGLMSLIALKTLGFNNIYTVDKNKNNLNLAKKFCCNQNYFIQNIKKEEFKLKFKKVNAVNIEMSGNKEVMALAIDNLPKNGTCILSGNVKKGVKIKIDPYDLIFGKKIIGFAGTNLSLEKNISSYSKMIQKIDIKKIRSLFKIYKLTSINQAVKDFKSGKVLRPLIKL